MFLFAAECCTCSRVVLVCMLFIVIAVYTQIGVNTLWLRDESGGKAFFPDRSNESFLFTSDVGNSIHSLIVEGSPDIRRSSYIPSGSESTSSSSAANPLMSSLPGPTPHALFSRKRKEDVMLRSYRLKWCLVIKSLLLTNWGRHLLI